MGTTASNQGTQTFFNSLGHAITSDLWATGAISGLLTNGIFCLVFPIDILAGLYIKSRKF